MEGEEKFEALKKEFILNAKQQINLLLNTTFEEVKQPGIKYKLAKARYNSIESYARFIEFYIDARPDSHTIS